MAVSCWGFSQHGRFSECPEGTWPVPIALSLLPPSWEQDVGEGPSHPNHSSGELQCAGALGKQEAMFLPRPSGFNRPFKQSLLSALKYVENSEAEWHPCKLYFPLGMHTGQSHCQISSVFCEWHQSDRCRMKEKITRMCPEFIPCRENVKRGSS